MLLASPARAGFFGGGGGSAGAGNPGGSPGDTQCNIGGVFGACLHVVDQAYAPAFTSGTANYFWATPNGSTGVPSLRAIVAADIPSLSYAPASGIALTALATQATDTILANDTAGSASPEAVAIAAQQAVCRITGGHVKGCSIAEMQTLLGLGASAYHADAYFLLAGGTAVAASNLIFTSDAQYDIPIRGATGYGRLPTSAGMQSFLGLGITVATNDVTFPGKVITTAADGSRELCLGNNTTYTPTASTYGFAYVAGLPKFNIYGTKYSPIYSPDATPLVFSGTLTNGDLCTYATGGVMSCNTPVPAAATPKTQVFTQCITIKDPVATSDYNVYITPVAIHVTATHCLIGGATNIVGQFDIAGTSGGSPAQV